MRFLLFNNFISYQGCGPDVINLCHDGKEESLEELLSKSIYLLFLLLYGNKY